MKRLIALAAALACLFAVPAFATSSGQLVNGRQQFINANGTPLASGVVYVYAPGTTTPVATYADPGLSTGNPFPIVLDSNGMASIWLPPGNYREVVQDVLGNVLFDQTTSTTGTSVGIATSLSPGATIGAGGDVNCTATQFTGSSPITLPCTLATTGVAAGTYGDSGHVAQVTVDAKGRVTSASSVAIPGLPAMSGSTSGALLTNNGSTASWSQRLSAYFSSCSSGGCTMSGGNGISGVTRQATGNYSVNFSTPMPSPNFTVICTAGAYGSGAWNAICADNTLNNARSTSSVDIEIVTGGDNPIDPSGGFSILIIQN